MKNAKPDDLMIELAQNELQDAPQLMPQENDIPADSAPSMVQAPQTGTPEVLTGNVFGGQPGVHGGSLGVFGNPSGPYGFNLWDSGGMPSGPVRHSLAFGGEPHDDRTPQFDSDRIDRQIHGRSNRDRPDQSSDNTSEPPVSTIISLEPDSATTSVTVTDDLTPASYTLHVNAFERDAGQPLTFNGQAELDAHIVVRSGKGDDHLTGGNGDDQLFGNEGNDTLVGRQGADTLDGGSGVDLVDYSASDAGVMVNLFTSEVSGGHAEGDILSGIENIHGSAHVDVLTGTGEANRLDGWKGDDTLYGLGGDDTFLAGDTGGTWYYGGDGFDIIDYSVSRTQIDLTGSDFSNVPGFEPVLFESVEGLIGTAGMDQLFGQMPQEVWCMDGADVVMITTTNARVHGGEGNDLFMAAGMNQWFDGGDGADTFTVVGSAAVIDLALGTAVGTGFSATLISVELVNGDDFADKISGDDENNVLSGGWGDDTLIGGAGNDTLYAHNSSFDDTDDDQLYGGDGNDWLGGSGDDSLYGGSGDDVLKITNTGTNWYVNGGTGNDTIFSEESINLSDPNVVSVENLVGNGKLTGTDGVNVITGSVHNDTIAGLGGADVLDGGYQESGGDCIDYSLSDAGVSVNLTTGRGFGGHAEGDTISDFEHIIGSAHSDTLVGDDNDNIFYGGAGADAVDGKGGSDTVSYIYSSQGMTLNLGTSEGWDGAAGDTFIAIENVSGSNYDDHFRGNTTDNSLWGNNGNDLIYGDLGNDMIYGGAGADTLCGDAGNDWLVGGTGADVFYGGEGADTFYFDSHATEVDVVKDFHSGVDTVRVDDWALGLSSISTAFGYDGENGGGSSATYVFDTWRNELWFDENGMEADGHHLIGVIEGDDLVETDLDIAMPGPY